MLVEARSRKAAWARCAGAEREDGDALDAVAPAGGDRAEIGARSATEPRTPSRAAIIPNSRMSSLLAGQGGVQAVTGSWCRIGPIVMAGSGDGCGIGQPT